METAKIKKKRPSVSHENRCALDKFVGRIRASFARNPTFGWSTALF